MSTLAEIRTKIAIRLQDEGFTGTSSATIDDYINDAINFYKYRRYWFNERKTNITLTQNDPVVPSIPSDFLVELPVAGLSIAYSNMVYEISKRPGNIFDSYDINGQGMPFIYTYRNQQFELYYRPQLAYTMIFRYLREYADLVNDGDTNDFTENAPVMLRYNAMSRIYAELKQDDKMEAYYTSRADNEEKNLKRRVDAAIGTGNLTTYPI